MKKIIMKKGVCGSILMVLILSSLSSACSKHADNGSGKNAASLLIGARTTQYFTQERVPEADMEHILQAGINAPSAMNQQPWHFTAVTNREILQQISDEMSASRPAQADRGESTVKKAGIADAPLAIIISCQEGSEFDAGLACQNMLAEAKLLGYGGKILSSPTIVLNGDKKAEYRSLLGIPEDQSAAAVLLVGSEDRSADETMDGVTGPSVRSNAADMVTYVTSE